MLEYDDSWFLLKPAGNGSWEIPEDELHHIRDVLRLKPGAMLHAADGRGLVERVELRDTARHWTAQRVETLQWQASPPPLSLVLAVLKGRDLEEPVEGLCQLPISDIHLVFTDHCQVHKDQSFSKLMERLRLKSLVALKQAKKSWLTEVHAPVTLREWRTAREKEALVVLHPGPDRLPPRNGRDTERVNILCGPEGGFSHAELEWLWKQTDVYPLGLGETRLRATHAPLVACGKLMGLGWEF